MSPGNHYSLFTIHYSLGLSVDPMSGKYPSQSPYVYCADNPVKLVDWNGEELIVADNEESRNDILSIVNDYNRCRVTFDEEGRVHVDMTDLKKEDAGLSLLHDLEVSDKRFYYEAADDAFFCDESGNRVFKNIANLDYNGVINASRYGKDSRGEYTELPMADFDGQVVIATSGSFTLHGRDVRKIIVFHELKENYLRTDKKMDYCGGNGIGAHRTVARIEHKSWGNFAGQCTYLPPVGIPHLKSKVVS